MANDICHTNAGQYMQATQVTRVYVWSRWLRLSHWLIAFSCLGLMASGYLMKTQPLANPGVEDLHYALTAVLLPALLVRLYLLFFGKGTDLLADCEPDIHRLSQAWEVIKFYLTLGKAPLPKWYSHNPLWGPLYLAFYFFLTLNVLSGLALINETSFLFNLSMLDLHTLTYLFITGFTLLHIIAVFSHEVSSSSSDISGMINGHRIFEIKQEPGKDSGSFQSVDLKDLMKSIKK
ncbi:MAG: cytochrome b/b6 domain-containing protein [Candidatus Thiodiazotropha sp.]